MGVTNGGMRAVDMIREPAAVLCVTPFAIAEKMASVVTLDHLEAEAAMRKRSDFKKLMKMVSLRLR